MEMRCALSGKSVIRIPLEDSRFLARFEQPYAVIHRHDIHAVLLRACQGHKLVELETGQTVEDFEQGEDGVTVRLASGKAARGRALVGCDGMWSKVRERIVGDGKPLVSGHIAYRAVLKRDEVPPDLWSPDVILWAGPRTHLVHYPLRRAELFNLVAVFHSKRYVEGWNAEADAADLWEHFKGQRPEVSRLLERIETWRMWVLCDREPVRDWSQGRVTLLGDAAHPMLQYLAQGACMANPRREGERGARRPACRLPCLCRAAIPAHRAGADHGARLRRLLPRARAGGGAAQHDAGRAHARGLLRGDRLALRRDGLTGAAFPAATGGRERCGSLNRALA
jgi:salicylate hydroxylase